MYRVWLICVGSCKEKYWREAVAEYQKRLSGFCKFTLVEVPEYRLPNDPSPAQIQKGLEEEGKALLAKCPAGAVKIPLCIEGKEMGSEKLASYLQTQGVGGSGSFALFIGGSYGLWEEVKQQGQLRLSISPMTFPHQLARVMVMEQLYRCFCILAGKTYHK